ncbi:LacI family transcriptional regulator [Streptomyces sp. AD2-2]|nr:LacI family transcriptional regulator [Streptomyces sp. AD2-2]
MRPSAPTPRRRGGKGPPVTSASRSPSAGRARLTDVAALAGVSVGTASKALNGAGRMRPETRQRVLDAVETLGFRPNQNAQSLHTGRSWTVGLMTTDGIGRFSTPVLLGAEDALGAGKISVLLCDTRGDAIREQHHLRNLMDRRVDGIIVTGRRTDPRPPLTGVDEIPVVYALSPSTAPDDTSVVSDDEGGARLAVEHLLATGRTRIAHVTGPAHHAAARDRARFAGDQLRVPGSNSPPGASTSASGARPGVAAQSTRSCVRHPTRTPSSAATTRSRAV